MIYKEVIAYEIYIAGIVTRNYISGDLHHESNIAAPLTGKATILLTSFWANR